MDFINHVVQQTVCKIVAAKFQEVSSKKNSDIKSLNLPNILEIRDPMDKSVADTNRVGPCHRFT